MKNIPLSIIMLLSVFLLTISCQTDPTNDETLFLLIGGYSKMVIKQVYIHRLASDLNKKCNQVDKRTDIQSLNFRY